MMTRLALLAPLALACQTVVAQPVGDPPKDYLRLQTETSRLDNGQPDWHEHSAGWRRQWSSRRSFQASVAAVRRFGLEDQRLTLDYARPLSAQWSLELEAAHSPTHRVLAQFTGGARVGWEFEPRWLLHTGLRASRYDTGSVHQASMGVEHYFGRYSAVATGQLTRSLGARATATQWRLNAHYGERNVVGLMVVHGHEVARMGPGVLRLIPVHADAVVGRHALSGPWTLAWSLEKTRQGSFYTRTASSLAVEHAF